MSFFVAGTTYPLLDPAHFDDDYGTGYGFAAVAADIPEGMAITMSDCWIVNDRGEVHPGLDSAAVPVRFEDVDPAGSFPSLPIIHQPD